MADIHALLQQIQTHFSGQILSHHVDLGQLTIVVPAESIRDVGLALRDLEPFSFDMLMDVCGVDYSTYGVDEWKKQLATFTGFSRGVMSIPHQMPVALKPDTRFAVVYHLLSIKHNHRLRIRAYVADALPMIDSVIDIWACANWYERETYDLFGILFKGHPDLRRLLTDYGFIGHPFRKDFPLIGNVEMRYDATAQRCVYEPVSIQPRTLVPRVIREDHRYVETEEEGVANV